MNQDYAAIVATGLHIRFASQQRGQARVYLGVIFEEFMGNKSNAHDLEKIAENAKESSHMGRALNRLAARIEEAKAEWADLLAEIDRDCTERLQKLSKRKVNKRWAAVEAAGKCFLVNCIEDELEIAEYMHARAGSWRDRHLAAEMESDPGIAAALRVHAAAIEAAELASITLRPDAAPNRKTGRL